MTRSLPSRWHADGFAPALAAAECVAALALARSGGDASGEWPPPGFSIVKDRPMRVVLRGRVAMTQPTGAARSTTGPTSLTRENADAVDVYVKVRRVVGPWRRARRLRGPKSPAEGRVLLRLSERRVDVPAVLGWSARPLSASANGDGEAGIPSGIPSGDSSASSAIDVLVLAAVPGARDLARWASRPRTRAERVRVAEGVGRLLRSAHDAGFSDRDFHRGNVLVAPERVLLVDAGTRLRRRPLSSSQRVAALAVAAHGLAADPRTGLLALRAYTGGDRREARRLLARVAPAAAIVARSYRRGRARRTTRTGRHFELFAPLGAGGRAVRSTDSTPASWREIAASLLEEGGLARVATRRLKDDGRVVAARLPGRAREVVIKRYDATWRDWFRTPRALRAFRRAYALRIRGVACPEPLLAAADAAGAGVYVAALAGPVRFGHPPRAERAAQAPEARPIDLDAALRGETGGPSSASAFARLSREERREALHRLGRFLRRMHDAEVSHRDLKAPNLVAWKARNGVSDSIQFAVVDLEGARARPRPVPWRRRARDLARLDASARTMDTALSRADRLRVLRGYFAAFERPHLPFDQMALIIGAASDRKRRRLARSSQRPRTTTPSRRLRAHDATRGPS